MYQRIYAALPVSLQNMACSFYSWKLNSRRYASPFDKTLAEAEERLAWAPDKLIEFRNVRLRAFVRHAANTVPYYRRLFADIGFDPDSVHSPDDLAPLPILTKSEAIKQGSDMYSGSVPKSARMMTHTSGSTGAGFHFPTTIKADREQWAVWWRYYRMHGIERGTPSAAFLAQHLVPIDQHNPPFWRQDSATSRTFFSSYHMSEANLPTYLQALRELKPRWIQGRPSSLTILASYVADSGDRLEHTIEWITSASENLTDHQAGLIESAFGVRPIQHYGMAEAIGNISQHPNGVLRVDEDFATIEFLDHPETNTKRIVGTNVSNLATPLIRYDPGDLALLGGTGFPREVRKFEGRGEDFIVLNNGQKIGAVNRIFENSVNIKEAQVRQSIPGEITVLVAKRPDYTARDDATLIASLQHYLGSDIIIDIEYTTMVERTPSGKVRAVVSDIAEARRE
jgi:phenylacetate-coenzyme A ligase PaaK-like adenylate-forming protein